MTQFYILKRVLVLLAASTVSACSSFGYYLDLMAGHSELLEQRKPVSEVINDENTNNNLREALLKSQKIRDFASKSLYLPENNSYRQYADLNRPFVVWNVVAAKKLSVEAKKWCFLFVGCLSYKGYFSKEEAETEAKRLAAAGYDVHIAGAKAYSTLGWFDDPLLNTMMYRSESRRAGIIFHELAHQLIYIENDTAFNEAFATVVEQEGIRKWFAKNGKHKEYADYLQQNKRDAQINDLLLETRKALMALYKSNAPAERKLISKKQHFALLQKKYQQLKKTWTGKNINAFDEWMTQDLNNSHLLLVATYYDLVPIFKNIMKEENNNFKRFYARVKKLGRINKNKATINVSQPKGRGSYEE